MQRLREKYAKYIARAKLDCEKYDSDEICCHEIVLQALEADVTIAQMRKVVIEGREEYWSNRATSIREEQYIEALNNLCEEVLSKGVVLRQLEEKFIADILDERPKIGQFDSSPVLSHYVSKTNYLTALNDWVKEQNDKKNVLERFFDDFISGLMDEAPKIDKLNTSKTFYIMSMYRIK